VSGVPDGVPGVPDGVPGVPDGVPGVLNGVPGVLNGVPGVHDGVPCAPQTGHSDGTLRQNTQTGHSGAPQTRTIQIC
jgi:preprotein translocase subunit SecD